MSITLLASGGLGNQLFQYAAARATSLRLGVDLVIDTRFYPPASRHGPMRFCLDRFPISARIVRYDSRWLPPHSIFRRAVRHLAGERGSARYIEPGLGFHQALLEVEDGTVLSGNFQSEKYFVDCADLIRSEVDLRALADNAPDDLTAGCVDAASIHVRRGDYLAIPGFPMKDPTAYYGQAMRRLSSDRPGLRFLVFSDDIAWCRQQPVFSGCEFFEPKVPCDHGVELYAMSQCAHHIIANSSFSWWAAWWNWRPDKIVIAPEHWIATVKSRDAGIVPERWIVM
jgi:hypothetical protein